MITLQLIALTVALAATEGTPTTAWRPEILPREDEIAAALEAGPPGIRDAAGVYVLTASGYELVRETSNGFHCILGRSVPDAFEPQCFDAEGSATLLQRVLLEGRLRMEGADAAAIEEAVARAWAEGRLRPPSRPGINYMLSPRNRVPVGPETVRPYRPHVMVYAPYLTNTEIGAGTGNPVFLIEEGTPRAYVIIPVPED